MYLFFDTETNGLPRNWKAPVHRISNWPRLVQLAWIAYDGEGQELARNEHIIRPEGFTIPLKASSIHGITTARAIEEGVELTSVLEEFKEQLHQAEYLVAHNMSFDEKIMGAEYLRAGHPNPLDPKIRICTMKESTDFCALPGRYGYKWPSLGELHFKLFKEDFEEAHNAAADISATARCFWELKNRGYLL